MLVRFVFTQEMSEGEFRVVPTKIVKKADGPIHILQIHKCDRRTYSACAVSVASAPRPIG